MICSSKLELNSVRVSILRRVVMFAPGGRRTSYLGGAFTFAAQRSRKHKLHDIPAMMIEGPGTLQLTALIFASVLHSGAWLEAVHAYTRSLGCTLHNHEHVPALRIIAARIQVHSASYFSQLHRNKPLCSRSKLSSQAPAT